MLVSSRTARSGQLIEEEDSDWNILPLNNGQLTVLHSN